MENGPVLVIDLDPGQCEFTVAGNISATVVRTPLLGPNYTHLKKPEMFVLLFIWLALYTTSIIWTILWRFCND